MTFKKLLFVFISLVSTGLLAGQTDPDSTARPLDTLVADTADVVTGFRRAESELVLLKNDGNLIPLQDLDSLRIAAINVGLGEHSEFFRTLEKYTLIERETPPRGDLDVWVDRLRDQYNLLVIGIEDYPMRAAPLPYQGLENALQRLSVEQRAVVIVFGSGHQVLNDMPVLGRAAGLVVTPHNEYAQSLAAQLLFGGVGASGRLESDLTEQFPAGSGLPSPAGLRLRYSPPEVAGFDRHRLIDSVQSIVTEGIRAGAYPGAQVIIARDGHVVFEQAFGYHTYDSLQSVTMQDVYDFASLTKITTALPALMKLSGEGRFALDAPLERYLPEWSNSNKGDLTFRRVLTHSGRLRAWIPFWRGTLRGNARYPWRKGWDNELINTGRYKCRTFKSDSSERFPVRVTDELWLHRNYYDKIYKSIRKSPLNAEPGYVYSDLSFFLWPIILPRITGRPYEQYLKETFYRPLGAWSMTYNAYRHFAANRIVPTERDTFFRMTLLHGTVHDEGAAMLSGISGHAGLFGSAGDLAKLMQLYLNKGTYGGRRYMTEQAVEEFTRYQYPEEGLRRGIGFDKPLLGPYDPAQHYVAEAASPESYGHTGYTGTFTWADPANGLLVIHFTNRVYPTRDNPKLGAMRLRARLQQACYDAIISEVAQK